MKQQSVLLVLLLAASSSPYGELQGAGAYFSDDVICEDGSNEEFCVVLGQGSCDFEHHSCGWNDTSKTNYRWRLELANITTTPGHDHTISSPGGHVMYVDGKVDTSWRPKATLIHLVNKTGAIGCQISFWYHIHDNATYPTASSFTLNMVRGSISEELQLLWKIEKPNTAGWENATAFIGNQPGGYKLEFSFERRSEVKDVMLDDIRFEYCEEGDIPAGSDQLSCNFTVNTCSWYHDHTASLMWIRSHKHNMDGPESDHTGNGYYMFIAAQKDPTSLARLMSLPQRPGGPGQSICVSFWYHIFGSSGSLKFITKRAGEETIVWMRSGTQGNKWRFADLTFTSTPDTPIQFIFEAVAGQQGSIAIDDIVVSSGSCPAERECTFQGSLCGLQPHPTTQFSWNRTRGAEMVNSSSPATDHTLGTEQGFYLSAQLWRHPMSSKVGMITALMEPTPASGECWMFWYHMEGNRVGELNIYLQTLQPHRTPECLWTKSGDQGKHWRHGRVTVLSVDTPYQVIFEAVGDGSKGDIAIDDLTVQNGVCPPAGFCDFEMDYCGWVNSLSEGSGMAWDWLSASSEGSLIPNRDHTTDSSLGHFVIFLAPESDKVQFVHLESELMGAVDHACLELWHRTEGWRQGPSDIMLTVFVNETSGLRSVWSTHGYTNNTWHRARVDYNASGQHQIILEARGTNKTDGSLALDDIYIMADRGCTDTVPTTTPNPTSPTITTPSASFTDCTFEQGLCNWVQETTDDEMDWDLLSGLQVDQPWDGPLYDHTMLNGQGSYLLLNGSGSKDGESAVISLHIKAQTSTLCVGFWHYMLGPSISSLDLLVRNTSSNKTWLVWNRRGSQDFEWMNAQVTINMTNMVEIMFSGHRDASSRGFISLDDVKVTEGVCSDQKVCGFESDLCDFENDVSHVGRWDRQRGTKDRLDHTYGTEHGFYLTASQSPVAQLLTAELSPMEAMCIRFWYWLPEAPSDSLSVHLKRSGEQEAALWQRSGLPSTGWEVAELTVSSPIQFRVVFKAAHVPDSMNSTVQLDDVSMKNGACSPLGSCDFETGQCTWTNVPQQDGHDWVQADGRFQGPPIDHTTQTPEGKFLLSPSLVQGQSSRAQVVSEWIQVKDTSSCLILWYHTDNSESATLRVYVRSGPSEEELLFQTNRSGPSWTRFSESIVKTPFFQVLIEADSTNSGYVAIDDIAVTSGLCPVNETSGAFTGCSFENDPCGWEDMSAGQFKWLRGRNATDNAGPSLDHTLGTEFGWYMAVVEDRGPEGSAASLNSPTMQQASSTCTLHFYYHMYGGVQGELKVSLKQDSRDTLLWWQSGDQGDSWRRGEVAVGRTPDHFTIAFEATRTFIAIDDVDFSNCTLPEPQPRCPEDMFTCNNTVCVEHSRVCDFSDDCGDESDEISCDQQGVRDRCSFEEGLCSWNRSELDILGMHWTHTSGETAWPGRGPPRDHTLNTAAGHFIIPGLALTEKGQMSEILSGTLLPSTNCTVRFYFYSLDDVIGTLTVRSRTYQSGVGDTVLWLKGQTHSYSWQRAEVTLTSTTNSKIVFCYQQGNGTRGLVAVDDISLSKACELDPNNSQLPTLPPTSAPPTTALPPTSAPPTPSTPPTKPCQDNEFFCWQSEVCILASLQCDYHIDCPLGEDEDTCGPCTFENGQCQWNDTSEGPSRWQRQRATNDTCPPTDHTTDTGYYMGVDSSEVLSLEARLQSPTLPPSLEARLQSPTLPPSSPYCQIVFHFHISGESDRSLGVIMQQADGGEAILWSRSHNTASQWSEERLPLGQQQHPYKIFFISIFHWLGPPHGDHAVAVDDISFLNCENSFQPPALSAYGCSFEKDLCSWAQGTEDEIDWQRRSGSTESPDTGPAGDHTTGTGQYLYIESSLPSVKGNRAQIKSSLLPPAGEKGYCFSFWYHMFGATVGSLKMVLQTSNDVTKILVWQLSGSQGDEWRQAQRHVTLAPVHQVILEASVGGEAGDIALDDITLTPGPCPASDVCDFEEGSCNWQQQPDDNSDWIRHWGPTPNPNTGPDSDHTTHTRTGHYYYVPSSVDDLTGQTARMVSPLYPAGKGACVQLWYHMYGRGMGTLNVYQQNEDGQKALLFSQAGDQGRLWRFAQASLVQHVKPYRIMVEGVKMAASTPVMTEEGDMAFDDVRVSDSPCTSPAFCDFESSLCGWSNVGGGVDQGDWLRGRGRDARPNTGPAVDHTTNSEQGYYLHVDNSLGQLGDQSFLISGIFQPATRGHCLTFWYHMYGSHVGTLNVYVFDRKTLTAGGGDGKAMLKWTETGDKGSRWQRANVSVDHDQPFWLMFVYQRKMDSGWKVALDDITILPDSCYSPPPPPIDPPHNDHSLVIGLVVGLGLLAGLGCMLVLSVYRRCFNTSSRHQSMADEPIVQNAVFDLYDCKIDGTQHGSESSVSFYNNLYDSSSVTETPVDT